MTSINDFKDVVENISKQGHLIGKITIYSDTSTDFDISFSNSKLIRFIYTDLKVINLISIPKTDSIEHFKLDFQKLISKLLQVIVTCLRYTGET